jgi:hypothetical protein
MAESPGKEPGTVVSDAASMMYEEAQGLTPEKKLKEKESGRDATGALALE